MLFLASNDTKYGTMQYLYNDVAFCQQLYNGKVFDQELIEEFLSPIIKKCVNVLDVGAHCGSHTIVYKSINPNVNVFCFEPQKDIYKVLNINIKLNRLENVQTFNFALGNNNCDAKMNDKVVDGPNTDKKLNNVDLFNFGGLQIGKDGEDIQIKKYDDLGFEHKVDFIKIDVEGFESIVIDGMLNMLKRDRPFIFFESNCKKITKSMKPYYNKFKRDIFEVLNDLNYKIDKINTDNYLASYVRHE